MKDKILFSQRESEIRTMDGFDAKKFKDSQLTLLEFWLDGENYEG